MAFSADGPADGLKVAAEMNLAYPIVPDPSRTVIKAYNVLHPTEGISRPAMFVINKKGEIAWKFIGQDAADRPPMESVLKQLQAAK